MFPDKKVSKTWKWTFTDIRVITRISLILIHCFMLEKTFCVPSSSVNIQTDNFHLNSFCDMRPNCDGDSELHERLMRQDSLAENENSLYNYPVTRRKRSFAPYRTGKTVASQVSQTLDNLLLHSDYDKRIRPQVRYHLRLKLNSSPLFLHNVNNFPHIINPAFIILSSLAVHPLRLSSICRFVLWAQWMKTHEHSTSTVIFVKSGWTSVLGLTKQME